MLWLPLAAAAFGGAWLSSHVNAFSRSWCYGNRNVCWRFDKSPECDEELRQIRLLAKSGSKAYRLDAHQTAASFLNRSFILPAYQGRSFYVESSKICGNHAEIFVSFSDATHMAFKLSRPLVDCERDIWVVDRYAYLDENPGTCCG